MTMTSEMPNAERVARDVLAKNGESSPHPALLADTIREVEYQGLATEEQESTPSLPTYTVDKNEYEVPCGHPMCDVFHKNLDDGHLVARTDWVILEDGERRGWAGTIETFETKRDAVAYLASHAPGVRG